MMYRILNVRQVRGEDFKVWFTDDYWDLFVWIDREKRISSFQLGYGKPDDEHIFSWRRGGGFSAMTVSDGEEDLTENRTPVMVKDSDFDAQTVRTRFLKDSKKINQKIADFVASKISQYRKK